MAIGPLKLSIQLLCLLIFNVLTRLRTTQEWRVVQAVCFEIVIFSERDVLRG